MRFECSSLIFCNYCLLLSLVCIAGHIDSSEIAPKVADRDIDQTVVGLIGTPGILHDVIGVTLFITCHSDNGHSMVNALIANWMTMTQSLIDMLT